MTKQDVFGRDLVFELVVEGKPVLWFPIWHFVPPEPVDRGLQVTRFQALNVADV